MTDALTIWREKLAGVTPPIGPLAWQVYGERTRIYEGAQQLGVAILGGDLWGKECAAHIVRSDRLSRILADEATARSYAKERFPEGGKEYLDAVTDARAVLNHLAQLALGDGT